MLLGLVPRRPQPQQPQGIFVSRNMLREAHRPKPLVRIIELLPDHRLQVNVEFLELMPHLWISQEI